MPLYEYQCRDCADRFERIVPMTASSDQACSCGGVAAKRITTVAFLGCAPSPTASDPGVPLRRRLPSSMRGVGGTRAGVAAAQRAEERLSRFESRNPEFADHKLPVVSHEGGQVVYAKKKAAETKAPAASPTTGAGA